MLIAILWVSSLVVMYFFASNNPWPSVKKKIIEKASQQSATKN